MGTVSSFTCCTYMMTSRLQPSGLGQGSFPHPSTPALPTLNGQQGSSKGLSPALPKDPALSQGQCLSIFYNSLSTTDLSTGVVVHALPRIGNCCKKKCQTELRVKPYNISCCGFFFFSERKHVTGQDRGAHHTGLAPNLPPSAEDKPTKGRCAASSVLGRLEPTSTSPIRGGDPKPPAPEPR